MNDNKINPHNIKIENRRLRAHVKELSEVVETLSEELLNEKKANGHRPQEGEGPPQWAERAKEVRERSPDKIADYDTIDSPQNNE